MGPLLFSPQISCYSPVGSVAYRTPHKPSGCAPALEASAKEASFASLLPTGRIAPVRSATNNPTRAAPADRRPRCPGLLRPRARLSLRAMTDGGAWTTDRGAQENTRATESRSQIGGAKARRAENSCIAAVGVQNAMSRLFSACSPRRGPPRPRGARGQRRNECRSVSRWLRHDGITAFVSYSRRWSRSFRTCRAAVGGHELPHRAGGAPSCWARGSVDDCGSRWPARSALRDVRAASPLATALRQIVGGNEAAAEPPAM